MRGVRAAIALALWQVLLPSVARGQTPLFRLDLTGTPIGDFPSSLQLLQGNLELVMRNGVPMLKASSVTEFLISLAQPLPSDFTLEFDLAPKHGSNPQDLSFEGTPRINRGEASAQVQWHATGYISVAGGGGDMYQAPMPDDLQASLPGVLTHVVFEAQGGTIKLYTNGRRLFTLQKQFVRGRVLRVSLGGQDGGTEAVYVAGLRISAGTGFATVAQATPPPGVPQQTVSPSQQGNPSQSTSQTFAIGTPAAAIVANVSVAAGPNGPVVSWLGGSAPATYAVKRWLISDPVCCNNASSLNPPLTGPPWQDTPPPLTGTYVYEVTARTSTAIATAQGQFDFQRAGTGQIIAPPGAGSRNVVIAPPPPPPPAPTSTPLPGVSSLPSRTTSGIQNVASGDPTGFSGSSPAPATVQLSWQSVAGATGYLVSGPGIPQGTIVPGTGYSVPRVSAGLQTYRVASVTSSGVGTQAASWPSAVVRVMPVPGIMLSRPQGLGSKADYNQHACNFGKWIAGQLMLPNGWCFIDAATGAADAKALPLLTVYGIQEFDDSWWPSPPVIRAANDWTLYSDWAWGRFDQEVPEATFGDIADLYRGRRVGCVQRGNGSAASTFCWASTTPHSAMTHFYTPPITFPSTLDFLIGKYAETAYDNVSVIVQTAQETSFLVLQKGQVPCGIGAVVPPCFGLVGKAEVQLDSQGPRSLPHLCMACHGGRFDPATGKVTGATLLALDPAGFSWGGVGRAREEERIRNINLAIFTSPGIAPGVLQYITDLYGGRQSVPGTTVDDNRVPSGWATQPGLYQQIYRPFCASCHSAMTGSLDFRSFGDLQREKDRVKAAVCGGTMPHAEVPFIKFWTRGGNVLLPGVLLASLGFTGC